MCVQVLAEIKGGHWISSLGTGVVKKGKSSDGG